MDPHKKVEAYLADDTMSEIGMSSDTGYSDAIQSRADMRDPGIDEAMRNEEFSKAIMNDNGLQVETLWSNHNQTYKKFVTFFVRVALEHKKNRALETLLKKLEDTKFSLDMKYFEDDQRKDLFLMSCKFGLSNLLKEIAKSRVLKEDDVIQGILACTKANSTHVSALPLLKKYPNIAADRILNTLMKAGEGCSREMMKMALKIRPDCSVDKQWEVCEFVCKMGFAECIPLLDKLPRNVDFVKIGLKSCKNDDMKTQRFILIAVNRTEGYEKRALSALKEKNEVFLEIAKHAFHPITLHPSKVESHNMNLFIDERIVHLDTNCVSDILQSPSLDVYMSSNSFSENAFQKILPCKECLKSLAPYGYRTCRQVLQLRNFRGQTKLA